MADERVDGWHLRKEITWGHIVSTLILAGTMMLAFNNISTRVELNTQRINFTEKTVQQQSEQNHRDRKEIRESLKDMQNKIDKLIDLQIKSANGNGN